MSLPAWNEPVLLEDAVIAGISDQCGATQAQVLLSWSVHRGIAVIPKSINSERMKQNLEAADVPLTEDQMKRIVRLDRKRRYIGGEFWAMKDSPYSVANLWDE